MDRRIRGVIVTCHPGLAALHGRAERIANQIAAIVVVDKTPDPALQAQIRATVPDSTDIPSRWQQNNDEAQPPTA